MKSIKFVCTANNGKSPIALAIAKDFFRKYLKEYFNIISEFGMQEDPYYRFYIMEKKNDKRKI